MGDGASFGMIQAIEENNAKDGATPVQFIDVIGDKSADHGDVLLTSVVFDYSGIYQQMLDDMKAGKFGGKYQMDVKNGGVRLLDLPERVSQDAKDAVAKAQEDIVSDKITVDAIGDAEAMKAKVEELFPK